MPDLFGVRRVVYGWLVPKCACGCGGEVTGIERQRRRGREKGEPVRFVKGHNARKAALGERWCGKCERSLPPEAFSPGHTRCRECRARLSREATAKLPRRPKGPVRAHRALRYRLRKRGATEACIDFALGVLLHDRCVYCGGEAESIDHICRDHAGTWENLAPACVSCNSRKRTTPLLVFLLRSG